MTTLLKIDVSSRGSLSISRTLGEQFVLDWRKNHPEGTVVPRDLAATALPFVDLNWILGAFTAEESQSAEAKAAIAVSDRLVAELKSCDQILLTTPMYNFGVPSILKAWIDHVVRSGKTFSAHADGSYSGLLGGKKATVIVSSAGKYEKGTPTEGFNFVSPYLKYIFGMMGITDITFIEAGATYTVDRAMTTLADYVQPILPSVAAAAK